MTLAMWKPSYNLTRSPQKPLSEPAKAVMLSGWRKRAELFALKGLTTRGKLPRRRLESRLVLADVDALAAVMAAEFNAMPPPVQAKMIELELSLGKIRKQLV